MNIKFRYNENIFNVDVENSLKFDKIYVGTAIDDVQLLFIKRLLNDRYEKRRDSTVDVN